MKKWNEPKLIDLDLKATEELDVDLMQSVASCDQTYTESIQNEGKGCSFTSCTYYKKHNQGNGNGGKCGGPDKTPES